MTVVFYIEGHIERYSFNWENTSPPAVIQLRDRGLTLELVSYSSGKDEWEYEEMTDISSLKNIHFTDHTGLTPDDRQE